LKNLTPNQKLSICIIQNNDFVVIENID
jgi:hypothetical protein